MDNDYEIIFWFKLASDKQFWAEMMRKRYHLLLCKIASTAFQKVYRLPITIEDLVLLQYETVYTCMELFQPIYKKQFKNFLYDRYHWKCVNSINQFFNNNHKVLNYSLSMDDPDAVVVCKNTDPLLENKPDYKALLQPIFAQLSTKEKTVIELKLANFTNPQIMRLAHMTYSQVDNSYQRAIAKMRKLLKCNSV